MNKWNKRFMGLAHEIGNWSSCYQDNRKVGAVIVKNKRILTTGYNGAPRGRTNCLDRDVCMRDELGIPSGERYELCRSVHAEANAIISAARRDMIGSTLYMTGIDAKTGELLDDTSSCSMCRRLIINSGIERTVCRSKGGKISIIHIRDWVFNDDSIIDGTKFSLT